MFFRFISKFRAENMIKAWLFYAFFVRSLHSAVALPKLLQRFSTALP